MATKRTIRVKGRIKFLTNSIKKRRKVKGKGVPSGIKCERNLLGKLIKLNKILVTQVVRERNNITLTCDERGKIKENTEKKFTLKSTKIQVKKIKWEDLLKDFLFSEEKKDAKFDSLALKISPYKVITLNWV